MKMKYLVIVSLILAVLTIGAACASEDVAIDDELAVSDEGVDVEATPADEEADIESASGEDVVSGDYDGIYMNIADEVDVNEAHSGFIANVYDEDSYFNGTISLSIDNTVYFTKSFNRANTDVDDFDIDMDDLTLPDSLKSGTHTILLSYLKNGVSTPKTLEKKVPFVYGTSVSQDDGSISVGETTFIRIDAAKGASGSATLYKYDQNAGKIGAPITTVSVVDGKAKIPVSGLAKGNHKLYLNYTVNGKNDYEYFYFYVSENTPGYTASTPSSITVGSDAVVTFSGPKTKGWVEIKVDGKSVKSVLYTGGVLSENIAGLSVGEHQISVSYDKGTDSYSNTFTVNVKAAPAKQTISLALKTVKVKKSAKKLVLQATLKINKKAVKGKTITFKFNGKTYKAKTNKKGVAKVTIKKAVLKKLKVGKKIKYQAKYSTKTVKKTAKVNK